MRAKFTVFCTALLLSIAAWGQVTAPSTPPQFFGMDWQFVNPYPMVDSSAYRFHDTPGTDWSNIEGCNPSTASNVATHPAGDPLNACYNWTSLDAKIAVVKSHGRDMLYTWLFVPGWNGAGANLKPNDVNCDGTGTDQDAINFANAFIRHVGVGVIKYYELWNEVDQITYWDNAAITSSCAGDATAPMKILVRMGRDFRNTIKAADPNAIVGSPSNAQTLNANVASNPWNKWFQQGGGAFVDFISIHGGGVNVGAACAVGGPLPSTENLITALANVKAAMASFSLSALPIEMTEGQWGANKNCQDLDFQTSYLTQMDGILFSAGIRRFYFYAWDVSQVFLATVRDGSTLSQTGIAYGVLEAWFNGATISGPCTVTGTIRRCDYSKAGNYTSELIWDNSKSCAPTYSFACTTGNVAVDPKWTDYVDTAGVTHTIVANTVPVGAKPILLEGTQAPVPITARTITADYFGMGIGQPTSLGPVGGVQNLPSVPCPGAFTFAMGQSTCLFSVSTVRILDSFLNGKGSKWADINTANGTYNWSQLDPFLTAARTAGTDLIYVVTGTPGWANASTRAKICSCQTADGAAYNTYSTSCTANSGCHGATVNGQTITFATHSTQYPPDDVFDTTTSCAVAPAGPGGKGDCAWRTFIYSLMQHAGCTPTQIANGDHGCVRFIEIWNEPNSCSPLTQYASCIGTTNVKALMLMQRDAYQIVKAYNPQLAVIMGGGQGHGSGRAQDGTAGWVARMLCKSPPPSGALDPGCATFPQGVGPYTDAITLHLYGLSTPETLAAWVATIQSNIPSGAGTCGANDCSQLPIWNSETGQDYTASANWAGAAAYLARSYLLAWAQGVQRYYWYQLDNDKNGPLWWIQGHTPLGAGTLEPSSATTLFPNAPAGLNYPGMAFSQVASWMNGTTMTTLCAPTSNSAVYTCGFSRATQPSYSAVAAWSTSGTVSFNVPAGFTQYRDLLSNITQLGACATTGTCKVNLTASPVLLENVSNGNPCGSLIGFLGTAVCPPGTSAFGAAVSGRGLTVNE